MWRQRRSAEDAQEPGVAILGANDGLPVLGLASVAEIAFPLPGSRSAFGKRAHAEPPDCIVLDLDVTDLPLHGRQEGRFFHGYYDSYCYLHRASPLHKATRRSIDATIRSTALPRLFPGAAGPCRGAKPVALAACEKSGVQIPQSRCLVVKHVLSIEHIPLTGSLLTR